MEMNLMVFIIDKNTIIFDAIDPHYDDYKNGKPACTIRGMTEQELTRISNVDIKNIEIVKDGCLNTLFRREITNIKIADMYKLDDGRTPVVISWKHPDPADEILSSAIAHYGEPAQVLKCIEELAELQLSLYRTLASYRPSDQHLLNYIRDHAEDDITICKNIVVSELITSPYKIDEVVLELADVEITTKQVRKILTTEEEFKKAKEFKLNRLEERIEGDSQ
jgi:hypothetical protein